jgi:hypothetical protein
VAGGVCASRSAPRDVLAAVPVVALLVAALHPSAAHAAADTASKNVDAAGAAVQRPGVSAGGRRLRRCLIPLGDLVDLLVELPWDERLVDRRRAPDPLIARADLGAARPFVMSVPHVVAGVLRVAEDRVDGLAAPRLPQAVLVFAVPSRRGELLEIAVELLHDLAEAETLHDVPSDDRRTHRIRHKPMLLLSLFRLVRVRMWMRLECVPVRCGSARVPALLHTLLHPTAGLLEQVAHEPLRNALLDAPGEDRGRGGLAERLVGREQADVSTLELPLDVSRVDHHAREAVDALDDHRVERRVRL